LIEVLRQALRPKLICMDMDGVLIDTSQSYDNCVIETVFQLSNKKVSLNQIRALRSLGGFNNDWVLSKQLLQDLGVPIDLDTVTKIFQQIYLGENNDGLVKNEIPLIDDLLSKKIRESRDQRFAIVTGRPLPEAKSGRKLVKLDDLDLVSLDDVIHGKPSPEGINLLQGKYSISSWMAGDNPDDMVAAVASNSMAIGIGLDNEFALKKAGADVVLGSINELNGWIG
jgi:histidinol-phosphate aminotransferase